MNTYSITFHTVAGALRHQWRRILISLLFFSLLGVTGGFLFNDKGTAQPGGGANPLNPVDFSLVPRTQNYYTDCLNTVTSAMNNLDNYMSVVSNSTKTEGEQLAALHTLSAQVQVLKSLKIVPLRSALAEVGAVYVPEEYLDGMAERYAQELETIQMNLIAAQAAAETVRQMDAPNFDGNFTESYTTLLSQSANYGNLLKDQAVTKKYLDNLENHMPEIRAECRRMEQELNSIREEVNALQDSFIPIADALAKEAGLTFTPAVNNKNKKEITVTHSHRASSRQESFAVIVLFCVLAGVCVGMFFAICREAQEERKRQTESMPQKPDAST